MENETWGHLTRRRFLTASGAAGAAGLAGAYGPPAQARAASGAGLRGLDVALGSAGEPTTNPTLARLARLNGNGEPLMFVDLAAVDRNTKVIVRFAKANRWAVRPALKAFQCPQLCAYILSRLPQPRGLVFHLRTVDQIMAYAPAGTDLLMGYPPTRGELRAYLQTAPPKRQRAHQLTLLASSVELLQDMGRLARTTPRPLPLSVGLEFDSGEGRGGFHRPADISAAIKVLRRHRDRLRLRAVLCYDGLATINSNETWRKDVAKMAREYYVRYLHQLQSEGADLFDAATLVRNGPASSNYRNWAGSRECNEISPGSAFVYAGYLKTFDHEGLASALVQAAPVLKDVGPYPSAPFTKVPLPPITGEEYFLKGSTWPDQGGTQPEFVYPASVEDDPREGGRCMVFAPPRELTTEDYVLCWPNQSGDGIDYFGALHAVRRGRVLDLWPTFTRWSTPSHD
jgi:D-serine deaminase-like pyridoxal phosphate-dependent protein